VHQGSLPAHGAFAVALHECVALLSFALAFAILGLSREERGAIRLKLSARLQRQG